MDGPCGSDAAMRQVDKRLAAASEGPAAAQDTEPEAAAMVNSTTAEARASGAVEGAGNSSATHAEVHAAEAAGNKAGCAQSDDSSGAPASTWGVDSASIFCTSDGSRATRDAVSCHASRAPSI